MQRTSTNLLLVGVFLLFLYLPFLSWLVTAEQSVSTTELRKLTGRPPLPDTLAAMQTYPRQFEQYYNDHFGFREYLLGYYNLLKYKLGDPPSKNVLFGEDGWLFYNSKEDGDPIGDYRHINIYTPEQLAESARVLAERQAWLKERGIAYLVIVAPNKESIYGELLPDYLSRVNPVSAYDQLLQYLQTHSTVPMLDLKSSLLQAKTASMPLFYKTDTHWNYYGANIAQYEIAKALAGLFPGKIKPFLLKPEDFIFQVERNRDLAIMLGLGAVLSETVPVVKPELSTSTCVRMLENEDNPANPNPYASFVTGCEQAKLRAVISRDSFFVHLQPYISLYFQRATYTWKKFGTPEFEAYLLKEQPDVVIDEIVERRLPL